MPVVFQKWYFREDARRNFDEDNSLLTLLYVFGDNHLRKGYGGQAKEMRGEPNGIGVRTKMLPSDGPGSYFGEEPQQIISQKRMVDEDFRPLFEHVRLGGIVVWPSDGIGTGLSRLPELAPTMDEYIRGKLAALIRTGKLFNQGAPQSRVDKEAEEHL